MKHRIDQVLRCLSELAAFVDADTLAGLLLGLDDPVYGWLPATLLVMILIAPLWGRQQG